MIERLDVAALGPGEPVIPGLARLPGPGNITFRRSGNTAEHYTCESTRRPVSRFRNRHHRGPGSLGTGYSGNRYRSHAIGSGGLAEYNAGQFDQYRSPADEYSKHYRFGFTLGAIALLIPLLILIETATRLGAARREERYSAMRLVGATPGQIAFFASIDAVASALVGALLGIGIFLLLQP